MQGRNQQIKVMRSTSIGEGTQIKTANPDEVYGLGVLEHRKLKPIDSAYKTSQF